MNSSSQILLGYMKGVKAAMTKAKASDEDIKAFETGASAYAKKIVANFKDYEFFIGESMDPDGMCVGTRTFDSAHLLTSSQGHPPQLPRGRCHPLRLPVEARS